MAPKGEVARKTEPPRPFCWRVQGNHFERPHIGGIVLVGIGVLNPAGIMSISLGGKISSFTKSP